MWWLQLPFWVFLFNSCWNELNKWCSLLLLCSLYSFCNPSHSKWEFLHLHHLTLQHWCMRRGWCSFPSSFPPFYSSQSVRLFFIWLVWLWVTYLFMRSQLFRLPLPVPLFLTPHSHYQPGFRDCYLAFHLSNQDSFSCPHWSRLPEYSQRNDLSGFCSIPNIIGTQSCLHPRVVSESWCHQSGNQGALQSQLIGVAFRLRRIGTH